MATLINERDGRRVVLRANHVFGRWEGSCDTWLQDKDVSRIHAVIRWHAGHWFVVDHSRNGSLLDERRLMPGHDVRLSPGQLLRFGNGENGAWRVVDLGEPVDMLVPLEPTLPPVALARHNLLPSARDPQLCLYEASEGQWAVDDGGVPRPLGDGDEVVVAGRRYRLQLAGEADVTRASARPDTGDLPLLAFHLSLDEEHTRLEVRCGEQLTDLGERSHHYCLATLARKRLEDARAGFDATAQGWLEAPRMASMLGVEPTHLNILIYRARDQLMSVLPEVDALARVVERRRGGLRLGDGLAFEIHRGSQVEGTYLPAVPEATARRG